MDSDHSYIRTSLREEFLLLIRDCMEDKLFDLKRAFFRSLASIKTERGDKIKEISNRRKNRNIKLVPFLVYSCQKHLQRHRSFAAKEAFLNIFLASIKANSYAQSNYLIKKEQAEFNDSTQVRDVSANLKEKFDSSVVLRTDNSKKRVGTFVLSPLVSKEPRSQQAKPQARPQDKKLSPVPTKPKKIAEFISNPTPVRSVPQSTKAHPDPKKHSSKPAPIKKELKTPKEEDARASLKPTGNKSTHQSKNSASGLEASHFNFSDLESRQMATTYTRGGSQESKPVTTHLYKGLKILSLLAGVKVKEYRKSFLHQVRKMNTGKIRKVISVYKRRHFITAEKTLAAVKFNLIRSAFSLIRSKRVVLVSKEMNNVRQVLLVGSLHRLFCHALTHRAVRAIKDETQRKLEEDISVSKASSEIIFNGVEICCYEQQPAEKKLLRAVQAVSEQIRGFKKTKKCFGLSLLLFYLFRNKHRSNSCKAWQQLKMHSNVRMLAQKGLRRLKNIFESTSIRKTHEAFAQVKDRADLTKSKNTCYMVDVLHVILKRRVFSPTFYFLKFDLARIQKNNLKLFQVFLNRVSKIVELKAVQVNAGSFAAIQTHDHQLLVKSKTKQVYPPVDIFDKKHRTRAMKDSKLSPNQLARPKMTSRDTKRVEERDAGNSKSARNRKAPSLQVCQPAERLKKDLYSSKPSVVTQGSSAAQKQTNTVQAQMDKDICRVTRMIKAITEDSIKKKKHKKTQSKLEDLKSLAVKTEDRRAPSQEIVKTYTDEEEEVEQVLAIVKMSCESGNPKPAEFERVGQMTVHDMKFVLVDKTTSLENAQTLNPFTLHNSKYNSKAADSLQTVSPNDYFSFQKSLIDPIARREVDKYNSDNSDLQPTPNPKDQPGTGKENYLSVRRTDASKETERTLKPLDSIASLNIERHSSTTGLKSDSLNPHLRSEAYPKKQKSRYQDCGSSSDEEEESSDVFNYLTIVKSSESKM